MFLDWFFLQKNFSWWRLFFASIFKENQVKKTNCIFFQTILGKNCFTNGRFRKYRISLRLKNGFLEIFSSLMIEMLASKKIQFFKFKAFKKKKEEKKSFLNVFFVAKKNYHKKKFVFFFQQISFVFISKIVQIGFHFLVKKHNLQYYFLNFFACDNKTTLPYNLILQWNSTEKIWEEEEKKFSNLPRYPPWKFFFNKASVKTKTIDIKNKKNKFLAINNLKNCQMFDSCCILYSYWILMSISIFRTGLDPIRIFYPTKKKNFSKHIFFFLVKKCFCSIGKYNASIYFYYYWMIKVMLQHAIEKKINKQFISKKKKKINAAIKTLIQLLAQIEKRKKKKGIFHREKIQLDKMEGGFFNFYNFLGVFFSFFGKKKKVFEKFFFFKIIQIPLAIIFCCQNKVFKKKKKKAIFFFYQLFSKIPRWTWPFDQQHPTFIFFCNEKKETSKKKGNIENNYQISSYCQYCYWNFFQNILKINWIIGEKKMAVKNWGMEFFISDNGGRKLERESKHGEIFFSFFFFFRWIIPFYFFNIDFFAFHLHPASCFQFFRKKKNKNFLYPNIYSNKNINPMYKIEEWHPSVLKFLKILFFFIKKNFNHSMQNFHYMLVVLSKRLITSCLDFYVFLWFILHQNIFQNWLFYYPFLAFGIRYENEKKKIKYVHANWKESCCFVSLIKKNKKKRKKKIFVLKNNFQIKFGFQKFFLSPSIDVISKMIERKKKKKSPDLFFSNVNYCCNWGMNRTHILSLKKIIVEEKKNFKKLDQLDRRHLKIFQNIISIGSCDHMSNENQIFILRFFQWDLLISNNINNHNDDENNYSTKTPSKNEVNQLFTLCYGSQYLTSSLKETKRKNRNDHPSSSNKIGINYNKKKMQCIFGFFLFEWRQNEELVFLPKKLTDQSCFSLNCLVILSVLFLFLDIRLEVERIFFLMFSKKKENQKKKKIKKIANLEMFFSLSFFFNHHTLKLLHNREKKPQIYPKKKIKYKNTFYWQLFQVKLKTSNHSLLFFFSQAKKAVLENWLQSILVDPFIRDTQTQKNNNNYFYFFSNDNNEDTNSYNIKRVSNQANRQNWFYFFGWEILQSLSTIFFIVRKEKWFFCLLKRYYHQEFEKKNFVINWTKKFFKIDPKMKKKNQFSIDFFQKFIGHQMIRRAIKKFWKILIFSTKKKIKDNYEMKKKIQENHTTKSEVFMREREKKGKIFFFFFFSFSSIFFQSTSIFTGNITPITTMNNNNTSNSIDLLEQLFFWWWKKRKIKKKKKSTDKNKKKKKLEIALDFSEIQWVWGPKPIMILNTMFVKESNAMIDERERKNFQLFINFSNFFFLFVTQH
jgi:hypothetical protein